MAASDLRTGRGGQWTVGATNLIKIAVQVCRLRSCALRDGCSLTLGGHLHVLVDPVMILQILRAQQKLRQRCLEQGMETSSKGREWHCHSSKADCVWHEARTVSAMVEMSASKTYLTRGIGIAEHVGHEPAAAEFLAWACNPCATQREGTICPQSSCNAAAGLMMSCRYQILSSKIPGSKAAFSVSCATLPSQN